MAQSEEKKEQIALKRLIPHTVVKAGGVDVIVPNGPKENATANKLLASQLRDFLQRQIKKYNDADAQATPKDIKDLAEAAKNIAQMSGDVYKAAEMMEGVESRPEPKTVAQSDEDIDLGSVVKNPVPTIKPDGDK